MFTNTRSSNYCITLSLHDALPICLTARLDTGRFSPRITWGRVQVRSLGSLVTSTAITKTRSEEHTTELQSRQLLVCRLMLQKNNVRFSPRITWGRVQVRSLGSLVT